MSSPSKISGINCFDLREYKMGIYFIAVGGTYFTMKELYIYILLFALNFAAVDTPYCITMEVVVLPTCTNLIYMMLSMASI